MKFELYKPTKPYIVTQPFGVNGEWYQKNGIDIIGHNGLDSDAYDGQLIYSAHDGTVTFTGEDGKGGLGVVVRTTAQFDYNGQSVFWKSIYWHCKPNTFKVKPGDIVKAGDVLAGADSTGFSTGTHLHFAIKPVTKNGEADWMWLNFEKDNGYYGAIDPAPYFNGFYAESAPLIKHNLQSQIGILEKVIQLLKALLTKKL